LIPSGKHKSSGYDPNYTPGKPLEWIPYERCSLINPPPPAKLGRKPRFHKYFHENKVKELTVHCTRDVLLFVARALCIKLGRKQRKKKEIWKILGDRCKLEDVKPLLDAAKMLVCRKHKKKEV